MIYPIFLSLPPLTVLIQQNNTMSHFQKQNSPVKISPFIENINVRIITL